MIAFRSPVEGRKGRVGRTIMRTDRMGAFLAVVFLAAAVHANGADGRSGPWPAEVKEFVPPQPGEHPRLFFRKTDIPALRERVKTPEGGRIIERCIELLDGATEVRPEGRYTIWDGAAYGFLYQMTGKQAYADLGRGSVQAALDGRKDKDKRYGVNPPNEPMRAGPSLAAIALAYDLCYDGWDEDYRGRLVAWIQTWAMRCAKRGGTVSLERLCLSPDNPNPVSNHFALQVGGAGLTVLALKGDAGVNQENLARYEQGVLKHARKVMTQDFGEGGYFHEHAGPGVIASTWTFVPWLKAERVAAGRDWLCSRPNGEWISLRFVMQTVSDGKGPFYLNRAWGSIGKDPGYGNDYLDQSRGSHGTYWCAGFGGIRPMYRPAMLWVYERFVEPTESSRYPELQGKRSFDVFQYPHRALYAMVNWPFDEKPRNPAEVLPKVAQDKTMGQYVFRNRWQDEDDIVVAALFAARTKHGTEKSGNRLILRAYRQRMSFCMLTGQDGGASECCPAEDGSGVASGNGQSVGVDFSGASGADAVVVVVGLGADGKLGGYNGPMARTHTLDAGGTRFAILTLSKDNKHPEPRVEGGAVLLGAQSVRFEDGRLQFGKMAGAPRLGM